MTLASTDPAVGPATAPVTLVEFSDFQCPFCQRVEPTLKQLRAKYGDKLRIVWKDFPLTQIHPQAFKAGEAGHCAGDQGKYWEYHDRLFENQQALQPADLKKHATDLGLDAAAFASCLDSSKYGERVRDGVSLGTSLGVNSTPTVFINGRRLSGAQPLEVFVADDRRGVEPEIGGGDGDAQFRMQNGQNAEGLSLDDRNCSRGPLPLRVAAVTLGSIWRCRATICRSPMPRRVTGASCPRARSGRRSRRSSPARAGSSTSSTAASRTRAPAAWSRRSSSTTPRARC